MLHLLTPFLQFGATGRQLVQLGKAIELSHAQRRGSIGLDWQLLKKLGELHNRGCGGPFPPHPGQQATSDLKPPDRGYDGTALGDLPKHGG